MAEQKDADLSALLPGARLNDGDGAATGNRKNRASYHAGSHSSTSDSQQGAQSATGTAPQPSRHSHARSRSVNLSPVLQAGPSFAPGTIKWDPFGGDSTRTAATIAHPLVQAKRLHAAATQSTNGIASSPLLRPTSPIYVNVNGLAAPAAAEFDGRSPLYAGSEGGSSSGGSDAGTSPDARRSSHILARAMEKSGSGGPVGFRPRSPRSPRDSVRRTASPSRAYAMPISPRLQAFASSGGHSRRRSSGSGAMFEPIVRLPSPSLPEGSPLRPTSPGQRFSLSSSRSVEPDAELPVDSIWPTSRPEASLPIMVNGVQAIPVASDNSISTPIPPSLKDELTSHGAYGINAIPMSGPSSPVRRTSSPIVDWSHAGQRMRRTPSPNVWQAAGGRRASQSPTLSTVSLPATSPTSTQPSSSSPRLAAPQPVARNLHNLTGQAMYRHGRSLSNASNEFDDSGSAAKELSKPASADVSPTHKGISPPRAPQVEVNDDVAIAGSSTARPTQREGKADGSVDISPPVATSPVQRFMPLLRRPSTENIWRPIPAANQGEAILRSQSPSFRSGSPAISPLGESPPKSRSFIGMPPRSGYELSDDPDDVGSEDGSVGSGRDSVGTNEDRDEDEEEDDDDDEEGRDELMEREDDDRPQPHVVNRLPDGRIIKPQRPSLRPGSVVVDAPSEVDDERGWEDEGKNVEDGDMVLDGENAQDEGADASDDVPLLEESLTTLERIFLFAKSEMTYHRVLVSHSLADWVMEVELNEAVEFVIPLLNGLACDASEVCMTFAPQLHRVMWYFFRNCPLSDSGEQAEETGANAEANEEDGSEEEKATRPRLPVSIFTPLLCALLLNSNATIADAAQTAIVYFFARLQGATLAGDTFEPSESEISVQQPESSVDGRSLERRPFDVNTMLITDAATREQKRVPLEAYDFGPVARKKIVDEYLDNVAMAIGHLLKDGEVNQDFVQSQSGFKPVEAKKHDDGQQEQVEDPTQSDSSSTQGEEEKKINEYGGEDSESRQQEEMVEDELIDLEAGIPSADEDMEQDEEDGWHRDDRDEELGDTAMASLDGASVTMSVEEEAAVGRMASISLLCALATESLLGQDFLFSTVVPELMLLAEDRTFFVRKEAAVAFGSLARMIGTEEIEKRDVLNLFTKLCNDQIWHVRQAACLSSPNVLGQVPDLKLRRAKVMELMDIFVTDVSRNVRIAALDIIGEVIYLLHDDPQGVPPKLLRHFLGQPWEESEADGEESKIGEGTRGVDSTAMLGTSDASQDEAGHSLGWHSNEYGADYPFQASSASEPDRPLVMAYNIPAVVLTLGAEKWSTLRTVHAELCNHVSPKVRRSLAASLHEIAKIIGQPAASSDLAQYVAHFVDHKFEQDGDVKMALLEHIDTFLQHIDMAKALSALQLLHELWTESDRFGMGVRFHNSWRLRHKLISKLPSLAQTFLLEDDQGVLVMLMQSALVDPVSAVRAEGVEAVSALYHQFADHDQVLADGFLGMLVDLCESRAGYRARVATLQALSKLCRSNIQRASIELLVMPRLVELSKDEIVDVRLALAALVVQICQVDSLYALPNSRSEHLLAVLRRLGNDDAALVRDKVAELLSPEDVDRLGPPSPSPDRPRRHLTLGPADGGPHHPPVAPEDELSNGDHAQADDAALFAMDDDEEEAEESGLEGETKGNGEKPVRRPAPSLANSTLARRRFFNGSTKQGQEAEANNAFGYSGYATLHHNDHHDPFQDMGDGQGAMIVLPHEEGDQDGTDSSGQQEQYMHYGNIGSDDDVAHHLLGIVDDSEAGRAAPFTYQDSSISLESPERPLNQSAVQNNAVPPTGNGRAAVRDPFLAFVAHQHFDLNDGSSHGVGTGHGAEMGRRRSSRGTPDAPLSPAQQRSTFEDDDEEEDHFRD